MKKILCILTALFALSSIWLSASLDKSHKRLSLVLHQRQFTFSTYYDIDSDQGSFGNIIKNAVSLRTSYQYFDRHGNNLAYANLRFFSLGSLFTWAATMDIYDGQNNDIGLIEGSILTLLPSKFCFYNEHSQLVGIAYMDADCLGFTVVDPKNEARIIASFHRVFVENIADHWTISIEDENAIDLRILLSFGAFALDKQAYFREDK